MPRLSRSFAIVLLALLWPVAAIGGPVTRVPDELLVRFRAGTAPAHAAALHAAAGAVPLRSFIGHELVPQPGDQRDSHDNEQHAAEDLDGPRVATQPTHATNRLSRPKCQQHERNSQPEAVRDDQEHTPRDRRSVIGRGDHHDTGQGGAQAGCPAEGEHCTQQRRADDGGDLRGVNLTCRCSGGTKPMKTKPITIVTTPPMRSSRSRLAINVVVMPSTATAPSRNTAAKPATNSAAAPATRSRACLPCCSSSTPTTAAR